MNNITLSGDRISQIDKEFTKINSMVTHPSSTMWKGIFKALKASFSRPFNVSWEVKIYLLVIFQVLFTTILLFLMAGLM